MQEQIQPSEQEKCGGRKDGHLFNEETKDIKHLPGKNVKNAQSNIHPQKYKK